MLVIEHDGHYHLSAEQQCDDAIRQDWLEHMGYTVLRFTNEQVLCDSENVISILSNILYKI